MVLWTNPYKLHLIHEHSGRKKIMEVKVVLRQNVLATDEQLLGSLFKLLNETAP